MKIDEVMEYIGCSRNTVMRYKKQGILTTKKDSKGKLVFDRKQVKKIVGQYEDNKDKFKITGSLEEIQNPAPPTPPKDVMETYEEKGDNPELLNDYGKQELMRVTQRLRDMGIIGYGGYGCN